MKTDFFLVDNLLHVGRFATGIADGRHRQISQKLVHGRHSFRRLVLQLIRGVIVITEQLGPRRPQLRRAHHNLTGIEFSSITITRKRRFHDTLA